MMLLKRIARTWHPTTFDLVIAFLFGLACAHVVPIGRMLGRVGEALDRFIHTMDAVAWPPSLAGEVVRPVVLLGLATFVIVAVGLWLRARRDAARPLPRRGVPVEIARGANSKPDEQAQMIARINAQLETQLAALLSFVSRYIKQSDAACASWSDAHSQLKVATSVEQIRSVVKLLVAQHEAEQRNARELRTRLEEAHVRSEEMRERLADAEMAARIDALTGVANRRWLETFLEEAVAQSHNEASPLCVMMTDIDRFKKINDTYGHEAGDAVIRRFADLLSNNVRATDLVARYGGEEFAVVLPRTASGNAFQIAEEIRSQLQDMQIQAGESDRLVGEVTASFGIAEIHEDEMPMSLIRRADRKLYESKRKGRNRTEVETVSCERTD